MNNSSLHLFSDLELTRVHFIGVCGTAMAAVAIELHRAGFTVTGSDSGIYPPMSDLLKSQNLTLFEGYRPENLPSKGLVVVGNAVSRGNPELETALDWRCQLISLPELIARRYLSGRRPIVVTGTHGKSTTTAMVAHILRSAGRNSGWLVGALPLDLEFPCVYTGGEDFVIEGDEYDTVWWDKRPKFLHYSPFVGIINAVEFDHSDIYPDLGAVKSAFRRFAGLLPQAGTLIVNGDDSNALEVAQSARCRIEKIGAGESNDWRLTSYVAAESGGVCGAFHAPDGDSGSIELNLLGEFNLRNGLAAIAAAQSVGVGWKDGVAALKSFRGVARRLQLLTEQAGISVWGDFGHHPTAVAGTLRALRERYPERRLWALFEPRSNTMARRYLQNELIEALALADRVTLAPIHRGVKIPEVERLDTAAVVSELRRRRRDAVAVETFDQVFADVAANLRVGDVIVVMSNGEFGGVKEKLWDWLKR